MSIKTGSQNTLEQLYGDELTRYVRNREITKKEIRVCIPSKIVSVDYNEMTCSCKPLIMEKVKNEQGVMVDIELPILLDVPLIYPSSKDFCITFPLSIDDEVLVFFSDLCIDSWWQSGGIQSQFEERRHDLSDGFAIPAQMSQQKKIVDFDSEKLIIRHRGSGGKIEISNGRTLVDGVDVYQLKQDFDALVEAFNQN